jgi:hypothetical protein
VAPKRRSVQLRYFTKGFKLGDIEARIINIIAGCYFMGWGGNKVLKKDEKKEIFHLEVEAAVNRFMSSQCSL